MKYLIITFVFTLALSIGALAQLDDQDSDFLVNSCKDALELVADDCAYYGDPAKGDADSGYDKACVEAIMTKYGYEKNYRVRDLNRAPQPGYNDYYCI